MLREELTEPVFELDTFGDFDSKGELVLVLDTDDDNDSLEVDVVVLETLGLVEVERLEDVDLVLEAERVEVLDRVGERVVVGVSVSERLELQVLVLLTDVVPVRDDEVLLETVLDTVTLFEGNEDFVVLRVSVIVLVCKALLVDVIEGFIVREDSAEKDGALVLVIVLEEEDEPDTLLVRALVLEDELDLVDVLDELVLRDGLVVLETVLEELEDRVLLEDAVLDFDGLELTDELLEEVAVLDVDVLLVDVRVVVGERVP